MKVKAQSGEGRLYTLNMLTVTIGYLCVSDIVNYVEKLHRDPNLKNSVNQIISFSLTTGRTGSWIILTVTLM